MNIRAGLTAAALLGTTLLASEPGGQAPLRFRIVAVNLSNVGRTGATPLDVSIERWSSDAELGRLRDALVEKGAGELLDALQDVKPRVGFIKSDRSLGWDLRYARRVDLPGGGYKVVFATDRPMSFSERLNRPRSVDYEYMVAELHVGPDGKGEGKLVPMAKVTFDKDDNLLEIENYASQPLQLTKVQEVRD